MKKFLLLVIVLILIGGGIFYWKKNQTVPPPPIPTPEVKWPEVRTIGESVEKRKIESYTYGDGDKHLLFVGGIHGGYEANSINLANKFIEYLNTSSTTIPANLKITVIPNANPDGLSKNIRFNANNVDLNRNFDCKWQATSTWRGNPVSAGTSVFSEPETIAIRDFVKNNQVDAAIFWHSQANAVYASECENGILPETRTIMNAYSKASGYKSVDVFDAYPVTGDAEGWLASIGIPAITVELSTHEAIEWDKNLAGAKAVIDYFSISR